MQVLTRRSSRGFTLIELMVTVVIATILISIAVPSYMQQIRQSRRTDARTAVLDAAGREERYFATNGAAYTNVSANLGYQTFPAVIGSGYYTLTVNVPATTPNAPAAPSYSVTAVPVAGQSQANDNTCQTFSVDSNGTQFATDNLNNNQTTTCWTQ